MTETTAEPQGCPSPTSAEGGPAWRAYINARQKVQAARLLDDAEALKLARAECAKAWDAAAYEAASTQEQPK